MQVTFYGVRGSIPTPGPETLRYGGNTACVHVVLADKTDIILDAGTGIRLLGKELVKTKSPIHLLLTHNHWDHIQGFPFFAPIYMPGRKIYVTPGVTEELHLDAFLQQMTGSYFPVPKEAIGSSIEIKTYKDDSWTLGTANIARMPMNHPGGGSCYTITDGKRKIAYVTDNELYPPYKKNSDFLAFVEFVKGADLLIHDAQYVIEDMPAKSGWGHSVAEEAIKLALAANVKKLALYSHDPERSDAMVDEIVEHANIIISIGGGNTQVIGAHEGLVFTL